MHVKQTGVWGREKNDPEQRKCIHELTQTESRFQDALSFPWKRVSRGAFRHFHFSFLGILGSCRPSGQRGETLKHVGD